MRAPYWPLGLLLLLAGLEPLSLADTECSAEQQCGKVLLMRAVPYEESLPFSPPPPKQGWTSIRDEMRGDTHVCEIVEADILYVPDPLLGPEVETKPPNAGQYLIHGIALTSGPFECGAVDHTSKARRSPQQNERATSVDYHFRGQTMYAAIESNAKWVKVVYHQDNQQQTVMQVPASQLLLPEEATFQIVGDLDRDGKADVWLQVSYGGDLRQELLLVSRNAAPGKLLREIGRTCPRLQCRL